MQAEGLDTPGTIDILIMNRFGSVYVGMTPDVCMIELVGCPFVFDVGFIYSVVIDDFTRTINKDSVYTWTYSKGSTKSPMLSRNIDGVGNAPVAQTRRRGLIVDSNSSFVTNQQIVTNTYSRYDGRELMLEWYKIQTEDRTVRTLPLVPFKCEDDVTPDLETRFMQLTKGVKNFQTLSTKRRGCFLGNCKVYATFPYGKEKNKVAYKIQFWNDAITEIGTFFNNQNSSEINYLLPIGIELGCAIRYSVEQGQEKKGFGGHYINLVIDSIIVIPGKKFYTRANYSANDVNNFILSGEAEGIREIAADMKAFDEQNLSWQTFYFIYNPVMFGDDYVSMECMKTTATQTDTRSVKHSIPYGVDENEVLEITGSDILGEGKCPSLVRVWQNRLFYSAPWTCDYLSGTITPEGNSSSMNQNLETGEEQKIKEEDNKEE